jgi:hypothetical protein
MEPKGYWNYSYSQIGDYNMIFVESIHTESTKEEIKLERLNISIWVIETYYSKNKHFLTF